MPLLFLRAPARLGMGSFFASFAQFVLLGAVLPAATPPSVPHAPAHRVAVPAGPRPQLVFTSPQAAVLAAPTTATLAIDGLSGRFYVPYIQVGPDLPVAVAHNGQPGRSVVDLVLDAGTAQQQEVRLTEAPWQTVFHGIAFGEHTLSARLYDRQDGPRRAIARPDPLATARLDHVARGDVIAALGDSTTAGLGEGPWQPGEAAILGVYTNWLAAEASLRPLHPDWITADGRNFPQLGAAMQSTSRPAFSVELARQLEIARGHPVLVINDGWSGTTSDGYMRISTSDVFARQMAGIRPNAWLINLGANDPLVGRAPAEYQDRLQSLVANLVNLYGAGPGSIHLACPSYAAGTARSTAEATYLPTIDALRSADGLGAAPNFFAFFHAHPEDVADSVHPNFAGYSAMAGLWSAALAGQAQGCV